MFMLSIFYIGNLMMINSDTSNSPSLWWERGADKWYYKDDWKGVCLYGGVTYQKTMELHEKAISGWIVLWGDRGYELKINGQEVGKNLDGGLIDDYDISEYILSSNKVIIIIESNEICAEGEIISKDGKVYPFKTDDSWIMDKNKKPQTRKMVVGPSHGAYHRSHNGRLMTYNDEELGKSLIAKSLARIQRINDQSIFLMKRFRPASEIISPDENSLWCIAERVAKPLIKEAHHIVHNEAIPAQKSGNYKDSIKKAIFAGNILTSAEIPILTATNIYKAEREIMHLENFNSMLRLSLDTDLFELRSLSSSARESYILNDWALSQKIMDRINEFNKDIRVRIEKTISLLGGVGNLDEFPEDRFAWLNARELIGNDPTNWHFSIFDEYIDLSGKWDFRIDPDNIGEERGWYKDNKNNGWQKIFVPCPWERQGIQEDNLKSPSDAPYKLGDARCGDKPYNGFAWYRKKIFIPINWMGQKIILKTGKIQDWGRIFINGVPIGEGQQEPPEEFEIPENMFHFGKENLITMQIYNHDNFGGIISGQIGLYIAGFAPEFIETPGPLSYIREYTLNEESKYTILSSAMSPASIISTHDKMLKFWGWEAKGYEPPSELRFKTEKGYQIVKFNGHFRFDGRELSENWVALHSEESDLLIMLANQPKEIVWEINSMNSNCLYIIYDNSPIIAGIIQLPSDTKEEIYCYWAMALRRYPISASECVQSEGNSLIQKCKIRYNYLEIDGFGMREPLTIAPLPILASYALKYNYPNLKVSEVNPVYKLKYADYLVKNSDTVEYEAPSVDRSKVMKGVGELFAKEKAEYNIRGGFTEDEMFRRMAEWGFDHCRYAFAFHADWDIPLVKYMGGPIIENNDEIWQRLDELVEKCNSVGMQMMLCWFFNEDDPQNDVAGAVRNSTRYWRAKPETKTNAFELWRRIAQRYANLPQWAISYDFFNEPAYMNADHWLEIMNELTEIIRSVDDKHTIVWESADGWAQPQWSLWMKPVNDKNTIYSFHHYGKHWGYAYDEYYPSYRSTIERTQIDHWLEAILFSLKYNVPIHCGEFGISMIQPESDGETWLNDYLAFFERFGIGWNWWNYSGDDIYRTGLCAGARISPYVKILTKWINRSGWGKSRFD